MDIIAGLGKTIGNPHHSFPDEAFEVVAEALQSEREADPLESAISALGQIGDERAIPLIAAFQRDPSDCIRLRAAIALGRFADEAPAIRVLLTLEASSGRDYINALRERFGTCGLPEASRSTFACSQLCE